MSLFGNGLTREPGRDLAAIRDGETWKTTLLSDAPALAQFAPRRGPLHCAQHSPAALSVPCALMMSRSRGS
jgi:hypothetical protein